MTLESKKNESMVEIVKKQKKEKVFDWIEKKSRNEKEKQVAYVNNCIINRSILNELLPSSDTHDRNRHLEDENKQHLHFFNI